MIRFKQPSKVVLLFIGLLMGSTGQASLLYDITDLGSGLGVDYPAWVESIRLGKNSSGQQLGWVQGLNGRYSASITNPGSTYKISLGVLPGDRHSFGYAINDSGQVTGYSEGAPGTQRAFVTTPMPSYPFYGGAFGMINLGTLRDGGRSTGLAISSNGLVTGYADTNLGLNHAFVASANGQMIDLGTLPDRNQSQGRGINSFGQVVGFSFGIDNTGTINAQNHAFVTVNNIITDLNNLLLSGSLGWILEVAEHINDEGQIVGFGSYYGEARSFLLTPVSAVPLPGSIWLFISGLLGLFSFKSRPKQQLTE
jgi:probable HAF family extracellular repeat protein